MKRIISTEKLPIKLWLEDIEPEALMQARNLANFPYAFQHIAIMPDAHCGFGMPIGGVLATREVIVPNAVGVDIGCGVCAIKTSLTVVDTQTLKRIMGRIRDAIPLGFNHHKAAQDKSRMPGEGRLDAKMKIITREYQSALHQLGTLGGGNHFIEIQKSDEGRIWIMLHSGSRNLGKQVADHHNKIAKTLSSRWRAIVPRQHDLAYLPLETLEGQNYLDEMNYCVEFALANRKLMMERICEIVNEIIPCTFETMINIAHNYAAKENHFGKDVLVHRKGATLANPGTIGIVPGSQGTQSYIVEGLGNPESFMSCSHGAGRVMSRNKAREVLSLKEEQEQLEAKGIIHSLRSRGDLDEAASAYKDIEEVMSNQSDLVRVLVRLEPLAVVKG